MSKLNPFWAALIGVAFAIGIIVPMAIHDSGSDDPGEPTATTRADTADATTKKVAPEFIGAWNKSRNATYSGKQTFIRYKNDTVISQDEIRIVQKPPRSASISDSNVDIINNGKETNCSIAEGRTFCQHSSVTPWEESTRKQLVALDSYFFSPNRLYSIRKSGDCFALTNIASGYDTPPYGTSAKFCFDAKTGAVSYREIVRSKGNRDVVTTTNISSDVLASSFVPPKEN